MQLSKKLVWYECGCSICSLCHVRIPVVSTHTVGKWAQCTATVRYLDYYQGYHTMLALSNSTSWEWMRADRISYMRGFKPWQLPFDRGLVWNGMYVCVSIWLDPDHLAGSEALLLCCTLWNDTNFMATMRTPRTRCIVLYSNIHE